MTTDQRKEAQQAVLDLFTLATGIPIGLWEVKNGKLKGSITSQSLANFEQHCVFIQQFPQGKKRCDEDQCLRAKAGLQSEDDLTVCYAGLYNQRVPIRVNNEIRAVLLYGEMQVEGQTFERQSEEKHQQAVQDLHLAPEQARQLHQLLRSSKQVSPTRLDQLKAAVKTVEELLYTFFAEEDRLQRNMEQMTHDIHIQLVAVVNDIDNLASEWPQLTHAERDDRFGALLSSAQAACAVSHTMGPFMEAYKFRLLPLLPLVNAARRTYFEQARRHGIEIDVRISNPEELLRISQEHMQQAINNLMHNAVKYSFRGAPERRRFVRVAGAVDGKHYVLTFANYGIGILPDEIEGGHLFRSGYKGRLTEGEYRSGSGRGLSFVKEIIEEHGGEIIVTSEPQGDAETDDVWQPYLTRFIVRLPRHFGR